MEENTNFLNEKINMSKYKVCPNCGNRHPAQFKDFKTCAFVYIECFDSDLKKLKVYGRYFSEYHKHSVKTFTRLDEISIEMLNSYLNLNSPKNE